MAASPKCEVRTNPVTKRLARNFDGLFPGRDLVQEPHLIVTVALQTQHRQSAMSDEMLTERQECFKVLMERMTRVKAHFDGKDQWCDFIDPATGAPFHTDSATTLVECDERYRSLGFEILELGCCRSLCNERFGQCLVMTSAFMSCSEDDLAAVLPLLEGR
ncbi:unnamed protein product [Polarella glacialis]|uniref:Uncharacterized protein n=1 Tax=Polarella glacialis TaxID=89957 RepID=A0A813H350_POLGL|nr:unnamed protein product [Polarella glacialis]CAE8647881.1 unnamed protein product [Polarella glacialis]